MAIATCSIKNLRVRYGNRLAVNDVSFEVFPGSGLALLGMNGAGKSSVVRSLMGIMPVRWGQVAVLGSPDTKKHLSRIGYCPEDATPPEFLLVSEYFGFLATIKIPERGERDRAVTEVMTGFDLPCDLRIGELSKGMMRRVVLAQAFLGSPELLVLDEPLNGLDPIMIASLRERLTGFRKQGGALIYSSHLLSEVERCCESVVILKEGRVTSSGPLQKLVDNFDSLESAFKTFAGGTT